MNPSGYQLFECPKCSAKLKTKNEDTEPPQHTVYFSDGFISGSNHSFPLLFVECPICHDGIFIADQSVQESNNSLVNDSFETGFPSPHLILEALLKPENHERERQIYLRKQFWYLGTHNLFGDELLINDYHFKNDWLDNLEFLESLLDENRPDEVLLKIEVNRQLGRFKKFKII